MSESEERPRPVKHHSPLEDHLAWRERVVVEKSRKMQSLHQGIRLGYVSQVDIFDLHDRNKSLPLMPESNRYHTESQKLIPISKDALLKEISCRPNAGVPQLNQINSFLPKYQENGHVTVNNAYRSKAIQPPKNDYTPSFYQKVERPIPVNPYKQRNRNFKSPQADYGAHSHVALPPYALMAPSGIPSNQKIPKNLYNSQKMIDNTALMQIGFDSVLNDKLVNKNRYNKRMVINDSPSREYMKSQIDLSFPELEQNSHVKKTKNGIVVKSALGQQTGLVILNSLKPIKMSVEKDTAKIQNRRLSIKEFQMQTVKGSPAQKRYLVEESEGMITSGRVGTVPLKMDTIRDSYVLPSRDSFLGVNMKFNRKRHLPNEDSGETMLIEQEVSPDNYERGMRLKAAKEKFFKRKAEYFIKKNLIKTSKKMNSLKRNEVV